MSDGPEVNYSLITHARDLEAFVERHRDASAYALDTEFEQRTSYLPRLALLQVACDDEVALIDPLEVTPTALASLLDSPATAVVHAAVNDLDLIESAVGVRPRLLLDTEIAGQLLGRPRTSLATLARDYLGVRLDKSEQTRDWLLRPLPERALRYAALDVAYLVELADRLGEDLTACGRDDAWREESEAVRIGEDDGDGATLWWRLKGFSRAPVEVRLRGQYLAIARDSLARQRNVIRARILPDDDLVELAFKPLPAHTLDSTHGSETGRAFAHALDEAAQAPPDQLWPADADVSDGPRGRRLSLMRLIAREVADEWSLSPATVATHRDLVRFERGLVSRLDRPWRQRAFANQLELLRSDQGGLALVDDRLRVVSLT
ncbi:MAG: hypothetical protein HKL87_08455 [Acidimicrobiaceae bacterium]|nr:hypothetical protein [Acidimicrobiaceae bacterium]